MPKGRVLFVPDGAQDLEPGDSPAHDADLLLQRSRATADRVFVSVIQSSTVLIIAGFVIGGGFEPVERARAVGGGNDSGRDLGLALSVIGVWMLTVGITHHLGFVRGIHRIRRILRDTGMIHDLPLPSSLSLGVAVMMLVIGLLSAVSVALSQGVFR